VGGTNVTTKGDLQGYSNVPARIPVSVDNYALVADAAAALGVSYKSLLTLLDYWVGGAQGSVPYRGNSQYTALAAGALGKLMQTRGVSNNPVWVSALALQASVFQSVAGNTLAVSGLDLDSQRGYFFHLRVRNINAGATAIYMNYNADLTQTNYDGQVLKGAASSPTAVRVNDGSLGSLLASNSGDFVGFIFRGADGIIRAIVVAPGAWSTNIEVREVAHSWRTPSVNLTGITFSSSVANGIDANSQAQIYSFGPNT
jgi:hypothetical protein